MAGILLFTLSAEEKLGFNSDVRPVLSDHCFACHGFDGNAREADLRLDTAEGAFEKRENGPAIVPGDSGKSLAWQRIISDDPDEVMPPADHFLKLDDQEKALLKRWIEEGAKYEKHWTFAEVQTPSLTGEQDHPIDELVSRRLKKEDLTLSPEADERTLIRRLSFDLRGLPPTPEEVKTFLDDSSPEAWGNLIDRFIADPAFGERFAWPWLDAARYADSNGFQGDRERTMWPWRDWVIEAINKNLPYDDFTVWQIAGDLLPDATFEQKLATGFLRNHAINGEGGSIAEENRVNYVFDMTETVGTVWMGLTFNCCRCHDHKYDPLAQRDYYAMTDFFNQTPVSGGDGDPQTKPVLVVPNQQQKKREQELLTTISSLEQQLADLTGKIDQPEDKAAWEDSLRASSTQSWEILPMAEFQSDNTSFKLLKDQSSLIKKGSAPFKSVYNITLDSSSGSISALRLEAMRHPNMTKGRLAPSDSGNFVLTNIAVHLIDKNGKKRTLPIHQAEATYEQSGYPVKNAFDKDNKSGWAIWNGKDIARDQAAVFRFKEPAIIAPGERLLVVLSHQSEFIKHIIGRFRLASSKKSPPALKDEDQTLITAIHLDPSKRSKDQKSLVQSEFLKTSPEFTQTDKKLSDTRLDLENLRKSIPKVMIMADRPERRKTNILAIGSYQDKGDEVEANTPGILPALESEGAANRLDLAQWLVDPKNPLTSRVTVNRLWQELFGIGLIKSAEDYGVQSEIPIHGELIDFLAADFVKSGWDYKKLVRSIVTSQVYRQSSKVDSLSLEKDPDNRFHARGPRYRLPSWMIRDQALAASGMLARQIGGTPVKPIQPLGIWAEATFGQKKYVPDTGEKLRRRSLYTFWRRISAPTMMFDNAKRENCEVGTYLTNSPLHALAVLNDPLYLEAARSLAYRAVDQNTEDPLSAAFEIVTMRVPSQEEKATLKEISERFRTSFQDNPASIKDLLEVGETPIRKDLPELQQATLTTVCLSLFNLDETLTKE